MAKLVYSAEACQPAIIPKQTAHWYRNELVPKPRSCPIKSYAENYVAIRDEGRPSATSRLSGPRRRPQPSPAVFKTPGASNIGQNLPSKGVSKGGHSTTQ